MTTAPQHRQGVSRRDLLVLVGALGLMPAVSQAQNPAARHLVGALPVFPWLKIGQTTVNEVRGPVQSMMNASPKPWFRQGASEITGGTFMSISTMAGRGIADEDGLRILTMVFDPSQRAQLAIFVVDKGWNNANVQPLINRITSRYASFAAPVRIQDGESEATDAYYLFDIGRYVIEIAIPQHGTNATVYFATKELHRKVRMADRTYDLFKSHLERIGN